MHEFEAAVRAAERGVRGMDLVMQAGMDLYVRFVRKEEGVCRNFVRAVLRGDKLALIDTQTKDTLAVLDRGFVQRNDFYEGMAVDIGNNTTVEWHR